MRTASLLPIASLFCCFAGKAQTAALPIVGDPSAINLLQDTASNYQTLTGYEFHANLKLIIPGQPWHFNGEATIVGPRDLLPNGHADMRQSGGRVGGMRLTSSGSPGSAQPPNISVPFSLVRGLDNIGDHLQRVERTGSETLKINGQDVACEILAVTYAPQDPDNPTPRQVTYSIAPAQDLVVRKTETASAGRYLSGLWTVSFDSMKFDQPTPQWLLNMASLPEVKLRKEWAHKRARIFRYLTWMALP